MKFENVVEVLRKAKVPCRIKEDADGTIDIELGYNYPDELVDDIYKAFNQNLPNNISICAHSSGGKVINTTVVGVNKIRSYWN